MKKRHLIWALILTGLWGLYLMSCTPKIEEFGEVPHHETTLKTAIGTILLNPANFIDKEVVVEGIIASECPTGGWINVRDNSNATIYVEMHGSTFAPLPQRVGKKVLVKGIVYQVGNISKETKILGKGIVIK